MKDKEKIFELLRAAAETPDEERYVEDLIRKVEKIMPPIEQIDEKHVKFDGRVYRKDERKQYYESHFSLHCEIWRFFFGEIPKGYDVHHSDLNRNHNDITNFELLTKSEHQKRHAAAKMSKFTCIVCGREFETATVFHNNCYCSDECRKIGAIQRSLINSKSCICEFCGREFLTPAYRNSRFCSQTCLNKSKERRETKKCPCCGKEFTSKICEHKKYCSIKCYHEARRKH